MAFNNVVGLTGGIGSGKSTVAELFGHLGVVVVDTDLISRELTDIDGEAMPLIRAEFGADISLSNGGLNRDAMRHLVFSDAMARQRLEAILHPQILEKSRQRLERAESPYSLLVVPLLFETPSFLSLTQCSLVVDCDDSTQLTRVMARDGMAYEQARAIIAAQLSRQDRLAKADNVITNNGDLLALADQVAEKHREYLVRFQGA